MTTAELFLGWHEDRFDLAPDMEMLADLQNDLSRNACGMAPASVWTLDVAKFSTMNALLDSWVGVLGKQLISDKESIESLEGTHTRNIVQQHISFLKCMDHTALLPDDPITRFSSRGFRVTDLGTLIDLSILGAFLPTKSIEPLTVLEVGCGFGRLAEGLRKWRPSGFRHVLVDAVPLSLMFTKLYLQAQFPEASIRQLSRNEALGALEDDFLIVPAWQIDQLSDLSFDICINIESFQEMKREHVENYLQLFDRNTHTDGMIYLSNSREYFLRADLEYPKNWQPLFKHRTPRSWTLDHPTEVYKKGLDSFRGQQALSEFYYQQELLEQRINSRT